MTKTLQIAPGHSAAGTLQVALREVGRDDALLKWPDDLSCGPIDPDDPAAREAWWGYDDWDLADELRAFWDRVTTTDERLVVWFSRHAASELAFFLAWAVRMGDRPYDIIDLAGFTYPYFREDGTSAMTLPAEAMFQVHAAGLKLLLDSGRRITARESAEAAQCWHRLKSENAPIRFITETGLTSAPLDHFDQRLLDQASIGWRRVYQVIGHTMALSSGPYQQTHSPMLHRRLVALVEEGKLEADGDPWEMQACRVRLVE